MALATAPTTASAHAPVRKDVPAALRLHLAVGVDHNDGQEGPADPAEDPVQAVSYLRVDQGETFRFGCEPAGVRARPYADNPRPALPCRDRGAGQHGRTPGLATASDSPVRRDSSRLQAVSVDDDCLRHDPVAGLQHGDVVQDRVRNGNFLDLALTEHPGQWGVKDGQPVKQPFGPVLLDHADDGVADCGEAEEGVPPLPEQEQQQEAAANNAVEQCQHVCPDNLPQTSARIVGNSVGQARKCSLPHIFGGEARSCRRVSSGREGAAAVLMRSP